MTKNDKKVFIHDLILDVKDEVLSKVDSMPENWDGLELRQYISDCFRQIVFDKTLIGKRKKNYINDISVNNL